MKWASTYDKTKLHKIVLLRLRDEILTFHRMGPLLIRNTFMILFMGYSVIGD